MRTFNLLACVALFGCGNSSSGDVWADTVDEFANAICTSTCVPEAQQAACLADVQTDLAQAKDELDPAGETKCQQCLQVKIDLLPAVVANGCQSTPAQDAQVLTACDLDPNVDYKDDGNPDDDEACAGFP